MKYKIEDLIDIPMFQSLQDKLNEIYSFPSAIIDNDGNILTATAWQDVCTKFHRVNKECEKECIKSDQYILGHINEADPAVSYKCPHGLVDNATPIIIDGIHYGNFFTGQFFLEDPDMEFFKNQANKYGFDMESYLDAVKKVPVWTKEQLDNYLFFIKGLIEVISVVGLKNLKEIEVNEKLKESEEKYRSLVESSHDPILTAKTDGFISSFNSAAEKLFGYTKEEVIGKHISLLAPKNFRENQKIIFEHFIKSRKSSTFETLRINKYGKEIPVEMSLSVTENTRGEIIAISAIIRDITERKKAEATLQRETIYLDKLFSSTPGAVAVLDSNSNVKRINRKFTELFGYESEEAVGRQINELIVPANLFDEANTLCSYDGIEKISEQEFDTIRKHKNGSLIDVSIIGSEIKIDNKIEGVYAIYNDIRKRKKDEVSLMESEQKYRALVENARETISVVQNGVMKFANSNIVKLTGYTFDEITKKSAMDILHPDDRDDVIAYINKRNNGEDVPNEYSFRIIDRKNNIKWIERKVTDIIWDGKPAFLIFDNDITKRKKVEEFLKKSEEQYRNLVSNISESLIIEDNDGKILFANTGFCEMFGYSEDEIHKLKLSDYVSPEYIDEVRQKHNQRILGFPVEEEYIYRGIKKDGTGIWIETKVTPLYENGRIIGTQALERDISERIKADELIRESELKFHSLFENILEGVALHSLVFDGNEEPVNYRIIDVNPRFEEILGLNKQDILGKLATEAYSTDEPPFGSQYFSVAVNHEPIIFEEYFPPMKKHFSISVTPWGLNGFATIFTDITERKQSESFQKLNADVLGILNDYENLSNTIELILKAIKKVSGFDAVGIRLEKNGDYPYYVQIGFADGFLKYENNLLERDNNGDICRDVNGNPSLECTCGLVISGKADLSLPFFTEYGSFWSNDTMPLLELSEDDDPRNNPRNRCIHSGYMSVAIIPIRSGNEIIGTLQLNDQKRDSFNENMINFFEGLSNSIGIALRRKKDEVVLRESEEKFRLLHENAGIGVGYFTVNGTVISYNRIAAEHMKGTPVDFIGKSIFELYPKEIAEEYFKRISSAVSAETAKEYVDEITLPDSKKWFVNTLNKITDIQNNILGIQIMSQDITELKNAEFELIKQKEFFEQMFSQSSISTLILDKDGWCERINPKLSEIFGIKPEHIEGKVYNIFKDEGIIQGGVIKHIEEVFKDHKTAEWEVFFDIGIAAESHNIEVKEKKKVWYSNWAYPVFDSDGNLGNVIIQHTDISERKRAEEELQKRMNELERFHNLAVGRELNMIELKKEVNELLKKLGQEEKYRIVE